MISITSNPIDLSSAYKYVSTDEAGAILFFFGTVRKSTRRPNEPLREVQRLEYEAYDKMAVQEMQKIASEACQRWNIQKYVIVHRTGKLLVGEMAVLVAVATPHRDDAFEAGRFIIDTLKASVPIWKKEVFDDGSVWVDAHP